MCTSSRKLHKRSFALRLTPGLVDQCPDRINPPPSRSHSLSLGLALIHISAPASPSSFILAFLTDPPLHLSPLTIPRPRPLISSSNVKWSPVRLPHPSPLCLLWFLPSLWKAHLSPPRLALSTFPSSPSLSDPCQSKPWGSPGTTSRGNPLKDVGGGGSKVSSGIKAKKQYRVIPLLKWTPYFTPPPICMLWVYPI